MKYCLSFCWRSGSDWPAPFAGPPHQKQMFWLEPHEIVRMYEERTATFHSMNEGVIAIDNQHHITIFNEKAKQIFNVRQETDGRLIWDVLKDSRLPEIVERNRAVYNEEIQVSGKVIMSAEFRSS